MKSVKSKVITGNVIEDVKLDMAELVKLGQRISPKALDYPNVNPKEVQKYYDNGMSVEEIVDLLRSMFR